MHYIDDPDQLPALADQGPRDGRHGVDRDDDFDPYPARHFGIDTGGDLHVGMEDAKRHLHVLLDRVLSGEEIVVVRHGTPVARIVPMDDATLATEPLVNAVAQSREQLTGGRPRIQVVRAVYDEGNQLPELPDPGPRNRVHGSDREFASRQRRR